MLAGTANSNARLLLLGNSNAVEFRPEFPDSRLDEIRMLAKRQSNNGPLSFEIQVKSARKENSTRRWEAVYIFDSDVNKLSGSTFTQITISELELGIIEPAPQKFRFVLGGDKENGIEIEDLSVQLSH